MSDKENLRDNISYHLKEKVKEELKERGISAYKLAAETNTNETLWKNFITKEQTILPSSEAIVRFADYIGAALDDVIGRDLAKEIELKKSKEININKKEVESNIPAFLTQLPKEALQSVMEVREKAAGFAHKSVQKPNVPKKSFVEKEQAKRSNKQNERSR
ncbi:MAG TPA: hypothetical protein LFV90_00595 [Rickettsia endosymbiont of Columbicola hoogstraali]|nr:hypothetical protein [Rickettsia endosymbiont of Columbicola hoogstraali]